jgi:hypothetical protein
MDFIKGGKQMADEMQSLRIEINDLTFENQQLRKDL